MPFAAAEIIATKNPKCPAHFSFVYLYLQAAARSAEPRESRTSWGCSSFAGCGLVLPRTPAARNCSELTAELSQPLPLVWTTPAGTAFSGRMTTTSTAGQVSPGALSGWSERIPDDGTVSVRRLADAGFRPTWISSRAVSANKCNITSLTRQTKARRIFSFSSATLDSPGFTNSAWLHYSP